ncbi:MAG: hypothetical protein WC471_03110 [Candidatus Woesearchaeota archaeon]
MKHDTMREKKEASTPEYSLDISLCLPEDFDRRLAEILEKIKRKTRSPGAFRLTSFPSTGKGK